MIYRFLSKYVLLTAFVLIFIGCGVRNNTEQTAPNKIIFETDMGNDIDDVLALAMLYSYMDVGQVELLAISSNKHSSYSIPFIDVMNTWYGYPEIPVGSVVYDAEMEKEEHLYTKSVLEFRNSENIFFAGNKTNYDKVPESVSLYRKILAEQQDQSVTIVSVGFSTNLARLLSSSPDQISSLSGKDLVAKKVKLLSLMGGNFVNPKFAEYNVVHDIPSAISLFSEWPTEIVVSPFELGNQIHYPSLSIESDFNWIDAHPLVVGYEAFSVMPYDRPTWDLMAVLYAVEGKNSNYFDYSPLGWINVDSNGYTHFAEDPDGNHRYLLLDSSEKKRVADRFVSLVSQKPANKAN